MTGASAPVALVTGASRGLGHAVAARLGALGWRVIALARTVGGLEELADAIEAAGGPSPTLVPLSVTDDGGLQRLCLALHERWGRVDLAVHCAAHAPPMSPSSNIIGKDFDRSVEINYVATCRLAAMVHPLLLAADSGTFIHVTDSRAGLPFFGAYGSSKAAAESFIRSWAAETARTGPAVRLFTPVPMPTALRARFHPGENPADLTPCAEEAARLLAETGFDAPVSARPVVE